MNRGRWIGAGLASAVAAAPLVFLLSPSSGIAADSADGRFENDCCGTIELSDGRMVLGEKKSVGYVIERDQAGPYVLPATFVGTWEDVGFEIDGSRPVVKLRLDRLPDPTAIQLPNARGSYTFKRQTRGR
jgi:hypothetical protein